MTKVFYGNVGNKYHIAAKGHATGSTECCAAASALMFTLAGFVTENPHIHIDVLVIDDGNMVVDFAGSHESEIVYEVIVKGFKMMQETYGEYVEMIPNTNFEPLGEILEEM